MQIGVGTNVFKEWFDDYPGDDWEEKEIKILGWLKGLCEGVEIRGTYTEIKSLSSDAIFKYKKALKPFKFITYHIFYLDKDYDKDFDKVMLSFVKKLNIKYVILHTDTYSKLKFKTKTPIILENSDPKKASYVNLQDLNEFDFPVVIDVCHIEKYKKGHFDRQISLVKNRIAEIHFSSPVGIEHGRFTGNHYLAHNSNFQIPKKIPRNIPWVLECRIPKDRIDLLEKEVQFIRNYYAK